MLGIGNENKVVARIKCQEAQAALAFQRIERVGIQIGICGRRTRSWQIVSELTDVAALADLLRLTPLLAGRREEVCREDVIGTVFDEENLDVLLRILCYLGKRVVDVGLINRHVMSTVVVDEVIVERLEEAPDAEEVSEVFLCHLANFTDELEATGVGAVESQRVVAESFEQLWVERRVMLGKMVIEIELPVHAHLAVERSREERFVTCCFVHNGGE